MTVARAILQSARIAELKQSTSSIAALCKAPAAVELPRARGDDGGRRRLLLLLAHERRRNAALIAELLR
jgi:hypothetical protein